MIPKTIKIPIEIELAPPSMYHQVGEDEWRTEPVSFEEAIIEQAAAILAKGFERTATEKLRGVMDRKVAEIVEAKISKAIDEILKEGWREYTPYGDQKGEPKTLRAKVLEMITRVEKPDPYGHNKTGGSLVDRAVQANLEVTLKDELEKVRKEAAEKFRAAIDQVMTAKLTETLKDALGLR